MPSLVTTFLVIGAVIILAILVRVASTVLRRPERPAVIDPDEDLKQTCELNYTPE